MPIDYSKYPDEWKSEIRPRILKRANNCCEFCYLKNHIIGFRDDKGAFTELQSESGKRKFVIIQDRVYNLYQILPNGYKLIQIILTVAHLDHDSKNHSVADDRLAALCQACHLNHDRSRHVQKRKYGKAVFEQPTLF